MCCKIFRVIDENGLQVEPENLKENDKVLISNAKRKDNLKIQTESGRTLVFDEVLNTTFQDVFLIKTKKHTWILEPI